MATEASATLGDYYGMTEDDDEIICNLNPNSMETTIQTYIHSIICAIGLTGNMLVIATYIFYKRTKTMTDVYLLNVALADLLFVIAFPFIIYNEQHNWEMGTVACKMLRGVYSINLYSGMLLLACISGDRYIAIVQARRFFGTRSKNLIYSRLVCTAIWVSAGALSLPTVIHTERFEETTLGQPNTTVTIECKMSFSHYETAKLMKVLVPILQVAMGFILPLLVMVFCYSSILFTLLRAQSSQRHKAVRVILAVVLVFFICHMPYNVALLTHTLSLFKQRDCVQEQIKLKLMAVTRSVAYLHCCLNPIIYAFIGVKFRNHFRRILGDLWCVGKQYIFSNCSPRATSDLYISGRNSSNGSREDRSTFTA